ncbi:uncharacterized protein BDZ99DRAFT_309 [Mytilinidion resinicola]|uniref:Uncharacterized protein n=1 Tax=Mytilinidion resinicola TaxID=574789 RepID=A0A6A6Z6K6_9PEZI|nr:uncharacterized protein BDZ99DRAFT_309 [Mytilinidion resinicola]KAF2816731.1 hypothetical protein BDZ99DRAFT_309 [Mytilinidion resinicola]
MIFIAVPQQRHAGKVHCRWKPSVTSALYGYPPWTFLLHPSPADHDVSHCRFDPCQLSPPLSFPEPASWPFIPSSRIAIRTRIWHAVVHVFPMPVSRACCTLYKLPSQYSATVTVADVAALVFPSLNSQLFLSDAPLKACLAVGAEVVGGVREEER